MVEYQRMFQRHLKMTFFLLAFYVLGWGFTPYHTIFQGLLLGTVFNMYSLWTIYSKVNRLGQAILDKKKVRSLGSLQRLAVSGLAVLIAIRFPETFHLLSVILGLVTFHIVIMIDLFIQSLRNNGKER